MNNNIVIDLKDFKRNYENVVKFSGNARTALGYPDLSTFKNNEQTLNYLSELLLKEDSAVVPIYYSLRPIFIELIARLTGNQELEKNHLKSNMIPGSLVLNIICKIVNLSNELFILAEHFIEQKNFFQFMIGITHNLDQNNLHVLLLSFYRLIGADRERFKKFVDSTVLYEILQSKEPQISALNRFLSIQILSLCLELSESVKLNMIQIYLSNDKNLKSHYEGDLDVDYQFLPLLEAQRISNFTKLPALSCQNEGDHKIVFSQEDLSPSVVSICGVLIPTFSDLQSQKSELVPIPKSLATLKHLACNIQSSKPTMLVGTLGSGKTFLINELSLLLRKDSNSSIIKIHLNDQTDAKILLGTYTSGDKPGSFKWKNGVLTTAVKEGKWVLIEDIDKAPTEVLSILLTLLEKRELTIPSRGEVVKAANGFQLISTIRTSSSNIPDMIGLRMWDLVKLPPLDNSDLKTILHFKFPLLEPFLEKFLILFETVSEIYNSKKFVSMNKASQPRMVSVRDFVKFCGRVDKILNTIKFKDVSQMISMEVFDMIFQEATDCFTSSIVEPLPFELLTNQIGQLLEIPTSRIQLFLSRNVPQLEDLGDSLKIGRATLKKSSLSLINKSINTTSFAKTSHSLRLMEQIGVSISMYEPILLVGETGTGKTTVVQQVAKMLNKKLTVINVSQQTEVGDLLGGYKPVNTKLIALPIQESFEELFNQTFSLKKNAKFVSLLSKCFNKNQWKNVVKLWQEAHKMSINHLTKKITEEEEENNTPKKKRKLNPEDRAKLMDQWNDFKVVIDNFEKQSMNLDSAFAFQFIEGSLVKAVRNGDWLLLDEINLAAPETLESIADLLSENKDQRNILLSESGDVESIKAHNDFRLFGCMNPSTDVGKKDLPLSIRSRFTEIYVHSPDRDITDLLMIIDKYIGKFAVGDEWCGNDIAQLYLEAKELANSNKIVDGANQKPHFSIRTLTRTLIYVCDIVSIYGLRRSLYEGFCMSFLTLLDLKSEQLLKPLIEKYTISRLKNARSVMKQIPADPSSSGNEYVQFRHYWMKHGPNELNPQPHYIITPFVEKNMLNLVRATSGRRFPVLIQGPTSSGKTSMINYLANITGHKFVRINNHEHTDLQEYLGTYISDETGKLVFKEGVLVEALRNGYWIVLDELNLAPTDVLEALNRLLDDNRELFIPETQEVVRPHPDFMLFSTQNPPGLYGGRKILSRAFRNRFLELHFDDIPQDELETILRERCQIAPTYGKKIVEVYKQLTVQRQATRFMEQGNSFATLRDLFRWAQREAVGYEQLAANGYMLLAERVRRSDEKLIVKQVIEKVMKVTLDMENYYQSLENVLLMSRESSVVWTKAMRRLAVLVQRALEHNEPLLLVGETGCGKTTICQLIAEFTGKQLVILNAHQNTETGDILGAQRPLRNRFEIQGQLISKMRHVLSANGIDSIEDGDSFDEICALFDSQLSFPNSSTEELQEIKSLRLSLSILFEWNDGPLIQAMKQGEFFLLDEISLADDSVLERLNSVLEPERSLLLAEKGTEDAFITADPGFKFLATMNPGGDYGKKELSPALRNRFTEIWVPSMDDFEDVKQIVEEKLNGELKTFTGAIVQFSEWFGKKFGGGNASSGVISLRDILAWVNFVNKSYLTTGNAEASFLHGASMVFIDALGTNNTAFLAESESKLAIQKQECVDKLSLFVGNDLAQYYNSAFEVSIDTETVKCGLYAIDRVPSTETVQLFNLQAPTTATNTMRVLRAMQVHQPILLEGSPGVGKTSLISALAAASGNKLTRINLSEQTDLIDLFGSDAPKDGGEAGEFVWRDAPFLRAMKQGEWVLLDEMNLASQSVLEGLNACLDHRGEAYIPELDKSFPCHPNFVVFAAQNPQYQGGGRKGLPKSFVNRFSVVYVDMLKAKDLNMIANHLYPRIDQDICGKLITFISKLEEQVVVKKLWGSLGSPWEFNLRDTLRWLQLYDSKLAAGVCSSPSEFLNIIVMQRFRTEKDREFAKALFIEVFGEYDEPKYAYTLGQEFLQAGNEVISRREFIQYTSDHKLVPLQCLNPAFDTVLKCVNYAWPLILTGPTGSGKTEIIRYVASIVGAQVSEFSMNSEVDSMDILGGYEQVDLTRMITSVCARLREWLLRITAINLQSSKSDSGAIAEALSLLSFLGDYSYGLLEFQVFVQKVEAFSSIFSDEMLSAIKLESLSLLTRIAASEKVRFEWFDGLLVQAIEKGSWLVLDNANLCSPSVLDRLNSLLEPNGCLIVNECSDSDGQPRVIKPHPNFRLFLTVDPKYGELSRAMRNRGVELFLEDLEVSATQFDREVLELGTKISGDESDLPSDLWQLSITKSVGKPLSGFVAATDSSVRLYAMILDVMTKAEKCDTNVVSTILTAALPFISKKSIQRWSETIQNSSQFDNSTKDVATQILERYVFLFENGIVDRLTEFYASSMGVDFSFVQYQALNPALSTCITPATTANSSHREPFYFFEVCFRVMRNQEFLRLLDERSLNSKLNELSELEKSAAVFNGRSIKSSPKWQTYKLVRGVITFIEKALERAITSESFSKSEGYFEGLFELDNVLQNLIKCCHQKDGSKLRVYQSLLEEWILQHATESYLNSSSMESLKSTVHSFSEELSLTTGFSVQQIWEHFRAIYPSSEEGWINQDSIRLLASEFDQVAIEQFDENYESIAQLRLLIISLYEDTLREKQDGFELVYQSLFKGVSTLRDISARFLNKREHHFQKEFSIVSNFAVSHSLFEGSLKEVDMNLHLLAGKGTQLLFHKKNLFKPYPVVFDHLFLNSDSQISDLFSNNLSTEILSSSTNFSKISGVQVTQSINDFSKLGSAVLKNSESILNDQVHLFKKLLLEWFLELCQLHFKDEDCLYMKNSLKLGADGIPAVTEFISKCGLSHFGAISNKFLLPAISISMEEKADVELLGKAWILFAAGCIQLFVPSSPLDPATFEYVEFDVELSKMEHFELFRQAWSEFVKVFNTAIDTPNQADQDQAKELSRPRVYRPERESCDQLFDTWNTFMTSAIGSEPVERLLQVALEFGTTAAKQMDIFQQNSSQFLSRLISGFSRYSDLNDVLRGFIFGLKFGFELLRIAQENKTTKFALTSGWSVDLIKITSPSKTVELFDSIREFCKTQTADHLIAEKVFIFFLKLFFVHNNTSIAEKDSLNDMIQQLFQGLYYRWSLRRMKAEEEEASKASLYKFTDNSEDLDEDFKELFPDFDEVMATDATGKLKVDSSIVEVYYELAQVYLELFLSDNSTCLEDIFEDGAALMTHMKIFTEKFKTGALDASLLTILIAEIFKSVSKFERRTKDLDFYNGFSPVETRNCVEIMVRIQGFANGLLQQWPEHATLQNIFRAATELMNYPVETPMAKLIAKVEQVYTFISEWEKYAHSKVSFKAQFDQLTQLIISWRKLELSSWQHLFDNEDLTLKKNLGKWWFYLFETIILPVLSEEQTLDTVKLLSALNIFLSQTSYGEFGYRLSLVKAFREHIKLVLPDSELLNALSNTISFFEQFKPAIDSHVQAEKKVLEKQIHEVILLASWKDVNIDALKQSARRSHQSLYKIVRKYRALINSPIISIIEQGVPSNKDSSSKAKYEFNSTWNLTPKAELSLIADDAMKIFPANRNIVTMDKNMKVYVSSFSSEAIPDIYEFSKDLLESMELLKNETPKKYSEETKSQIAALKTQKRKLLSDTLKELRRIGIKSSVTPDTLKMQSTINLVLASSESFHGSSIEGSDSYYFRLLDLIPRLRASVSNCVAEVPVNDAQRGLAIIENLLFSLIITRSRVRRLADFVSDIEVTWKQFAHISESKSLVMASSSKELQVNIQNSLYAIQWIPTLCDHYNSAIEAALSLSKSFCDSKIFEEIKEAVEQFRFRFEQFSSDTVLDQQCTEIVLEFKSFISQTVDNLRNWQLNNTNYAFFAESFIEWISKNFHSLSFTSDEEQPELGSVENMQEKFKNLITSIVLSIQKVVELQKSQQIDLEEDNWLMESQQRLFKFVQLLSPKRISKRLNDCLESTLNIEHDDQTSSLAASFSYALLPFLKNYVDLLTLVLNKLVQNYINTSHGTLIMGLSLHNLTTQGFCSPEEEQQQQDSENMKDGTGLGDGEGANNNSNDVEDDEDLSEAAQLPNEDQKDKDELDEDNDAVDIEGDMAGNLEDAPPEDDEKDEEDGEDEDLDEEIDDLDDLDPNAIDDKMWDEEAKEDKKEKDSEQMPEDSKENEDLQANEDEDDENTQDKSEKKKENGEEEEDPNNENEDNEEGDEEGDDEEDVGEQEDAVTNNEDNQLDPNTEEAEALELPEDMNLDSGDEDKEDEVDEEDENNNEDGPDIDMEEETNIDNKKDDKGEEEEEAAEEEVEDDNATLEGQEDDEMAEEEDEEAEATTDKKDDIEAGVESEEELEENKEEDAKQEENIKNETEGVDGIEDGAEDVEMDPDAAAKQNDGQEGEGAETGTSEEKQDVGASGSAQQQQEEKPEMDNSSTNDDARDQAKESLKQLGDSLKEFHRRHQEILELEEDNLAEQAANEKPDEFQHLDGDNTEQETQALGAANKDQVKSIDDEMAIDEDEEEANEPEIKKEAPEDQQLLESKEADDLEEVQDLQPDEEDFNGKSSAGVMGTKKEESFDEAEFFNKLSDDEMDVVDDEEDIKRVVGQDLDDEAPRSLEEARELWRESDIATQDLAANLCEQLRLILEPTLATKLKGDYKTGKRLNMKRIIPYIASQFRKDKIWLRRTKPSKRQYQIMIAVDDSKSMAESKAVSLAFESIALVSKALTQLESGGLSIVKFGEDTQVVHPFDKPFTSETGAKVFQWFDFKQTKTDIKKLCSTSINLFNDFGAASSDLWQLEIIISDGVCEDHETVQRLVRKAREEKIMLVFVIIDGINSNESIMEMSQISYVPDADGKMVLQVDKYLDTFPFEFYVVVHNVSELPQMLSVILRQYFSELASA